MQSPARSRSLDDDVNQVIGVIVECRARRMSLVRGGNMVGIVNIGDLVEFRPSADPVGCCGRLR